MGSVDQACSFPPLKHEKALSLNSVSEYDEWGYLTKQDETGEPVFSIFYFT